jgi:hypothetical protein
MTGDHHGTGRASAVRACHRSEGIPQSLPDEDPTLMLVAKRTTLPAIQHGHGSVHSRQFTTNRLRTKQLRYDFNGMYECPYEASIRENGFWITFRCETLPALGYTKRHDIVYTGIHFNEKLSHLSSQLP